MHSSNTHVAIIGGGCAGLSAAAALVERGIQVTLFEASPHLGGRARSVSINNKVLDNGQHMLLGAYRETLALLSKVGVDEKSAFLRLPLQMHMLATQNEAAFSLKSIHALPAPLNLLMGFLLCSGISFTERINAIRFMFSLRISSYKISQDIPLEEFLIAHDQNTRLIKVLWEPLCLAALNTPIAIASTKVFLNVLRDSFSGKKQNSDFLLPKLDLSQIISQPVANYIQAKGGNIKLNTRVETLQVEAEGYSCTTRHQKSNFSHVVIATSPAHSSKLIAPLTNLRQEFLQIQSHDFQPIYTVYFQYPTDTLLPRVMTGLTNTISQWVFDRGQLSNDSGLIAVVVSAEGRHQELSHDDLAVKVANELKQAFPALSTPLWHKVIAEKRATFSCRYNLTRINNDTAMTGFYLAGDYTYADYPATIEGAVRSGVQCAELITAICQK